jgi:hypothetical protein
LQEEYLLLFFAFPKLIIRILYEEAVFTNDLPGYTEYEQKASYRLLPYIWKPSGNGTAIYALST